MSDLQAARRGFRKVSPSLWISLTPSFLSIAWLLSESRFCSRPCRTVGAGKQIKTRVIWVEQPHKYSTRLDIAGKKQEMIDIFQLDRPYRKCHMNEKGRTKSKIILWLEVSLFLESVSDIGTFYLNLMTELSFFRFVRMFSWDLWHGCVW